MPGRRARVVRPTLLLVTESLTLMPGKRRVPDLAIWYSRCTPVVVSSDTPTIAAALRVQRVGSVLSVLAMSLSTILNSGSSVLLGSGTAPVSLKAFSAFTPSWMRRVASPPSSTIRLGVSEP